MAWLGAIALVIPFCPPLAIFLIVALLAWKSLSGFVVDVQPKWVMPLMRRPYDWDTLRRDIEFDEAGRLGAEGEVAVIRFLADLPDDYIILHDVTVPVARGTTQIDLLALSPCGVWCLEVKAWAGRVYGQENEASWTQVKLYAGKPVKDRRENPIQQNAYHCQALCSYFASMGLYIPVRPVVVFTRAQLFTQTSTPVVRSRDLPAMVRNSAGPAALTPEQVTELAMNLRSLIKEPARQSYSTVPAAACQQAEAVRAAAPAMAAPAPVSYPIAPEQPPPSTPERPTPLLERLAPLLARLALKGALLALSFGLVMALTAAGCAALNGAFASLAPSPHSKPILPFATAFPLGVLFWLSLMMQTFLPGKRRRRR